MITQDMKNYIINHIDVKAFYESEFPDIKWRDSHEVDVYCPFHPDQKGGTASMSVNPTTGAYFCHSCSEGGNNILSYYKKVNDLNTRFACKEMYQKFIRPIIPSKVIEKCHDELLAVPTALNFLTGKKKLSIETIKKFKLGFNGLRLTIPIVNEFGWYINMKMYDPLAKKHRKSKMIHYTSNKEKRSYGSPITFFPFNVLQNAKSNIVICEGEWDAMILNQMGIDAITPTSGASSWPSQYDRMFAGLNVVIIYDTDEAGVNGQKNVFSHLAKIARSIKIIEVPEKVGKDVSDWYINDKSMRNKKSWIEVFNKTKSVSSIDNNITPLSQSAPIEVPLALASESKWYNKLIKVSSMVTGKDIAPYILPKKVRVVCNKAEPCKDCPLNSEKSIIEVDPTSPDILKMVNVPENAIRSIVLKMGGIEPGKCSAKLEILETFNLEQLILIPTLDSDKGQYVMRSSYYLGHGTIPNREYEFEGVTVPDPKDQHSTHLFYTKKPIQDEINTFIMTPKLREELMIFQPKLNLMAHMMAMANWQSNHITKIRERPDMHIAVDLAFHSVQGFDFNSEKISRGMLDVLILGDTRCGKGYVTERLAKYYGLGDVASGENCTFAGLVGGLQQINKRWIVTWGLIPLNHNRLVIIDEMSSISEEEIGHMSRVRSEGVAEISKIIREQTPANTRLIWLSNPRSGQSIMTYNTGVEAIKELIGNNEDISRFDLAMTVASNEVPSEIINTSDPYDDTGNDKYPANLCRSLVLWAWSRKPDQIVFTQKTIQTIIDMSIEFGKRYSPNIPLIQAENIRVKIAKIAVAVAARTFSCDSTCERIIVKPEHVKFVEQFLKMIYSKSSMSYDVFSQSAKVSARIAKEEDIDRLFDNVGNNPKMVVRGLLELHRITPDTLGDFVGDVISAKTLISDLVKLRCISRDDFGKGYIKNPAFTLWLRKYRNRQ